GVAVLLGLIAISGFTYVVYRKGKEMAESFKDPKAREAKTREVLPYTELPAGYYPGGAMSIPFLMDFVVFTDREPTSGQGPDQGNFDERSFIFMNMRHLRDNREKMERYLRGEAPAPEDSAWSKSNVNFDAKKVIRRGQVEVGGQTVLYQASQGEITHKGVETGGVSVEQKKEGIVTMVLPECADDRLRFGIWMGPPPAGAVDDYTGTPADPAALQEFLGHFRLCEGKG
ncbi:MAG: hypothetical protein ABIS20_15725, partial [Thermoanaerobaculia bacterium]